LKGWPVVLHELSIRGERVLLHPDRAVLWPARKALIVADTHFGKDDIFRRSGIALPRGPAIEDLQRLGELIRTYACERLVVLGDFVHGATRPGDSFLHAFSLWRSAQSGLRIDIVAGNHDRSESGHAWEALAGWHTKPLVEAPFVLTHHPEQHAAGYVLAGHIHPVLRLRRKAGAGRVPVFWQREDALVLPSFGSFTGGAAVRPKPGERLYLAGPERVVALPDAAVD
jgi:DNA ligase-associated metallophosphoesterase